MSHVSHCSNLGYNLFLFFFAFRYKPVLTQSACVGEMIVRLLLLSCEPDDLRVLDFVTVVLHWALVFAFPSLSWWDCGAYRATHCCNSLCTTDQEPLTTSWKSPLIKHKCSSSSVSSENMYWCFSLEKKIYCMLLFFLVSFFKKMFSSLDFKWNLYTRWIYCKYMLCISAVCTQTCWQQNPACAVRRSLTWFCLTGTKERCGFQVHVKVETGSMNKKNIQTNNLFVFVWFLCVKKKDMFCELKIKNFDLSLTNH